MDHPQIRLLQKTTRALLASDALRRHAWPLVRSIRERYARRHPGIELDATFDDNVRARLLLSSHIEAQLFWQGFQEADAATVRAMKRLLPSDGVFIDCGANIGSFTLVAAKQATAGRVYAFEPSKTHLQRLRTNVAMNGFANVRIIEAGLSDEPGVANLFLPDASSQMNNTGGATMFEGESTHGWRREDIQLVRLDDCVNQTEIGRVDVVKIDVEGAELKVLEGSKAMLRRFRPAVLMEIEKDNLARAGVLVEDILRFWRDLNYTIYCLRGDGVAAKELSDVGQLKPHQNVLCLPRGI